MTCTRTILALTAAGLLAGCACGSDDGNDKDAGPGDSAVNVPFDHDALLQACVRLYACGVDRKPRLQDCVDNYYNNQVSVGFTKLYQAMYYCANQGNGDCKTIRNCLGYSNRLQQGECDNTFAPACEGEVAQTCDLVGGGLKRAVDCSKGGLKCAVRITGSGAKTAACTIETCNKDLFTPECRNNQLLTCQGGAIQMNDCGARQLQCRDPLVNLCEGTGASCNSATTTPKCEGTKLVDCVQNYLSEIDCSKEPGKRKCDPNTVKCVGAGTECDTNNQTTFDACQGDSLVVCIDGFKRTFDCKKMGFLGCEAAATYGANCKAEPVYD